MGGTPGARHLQACARLLPRPNTQRPCTPRTSNFLKFATNIAASCRSAASYALLSAQVPPGSSRPGGTPGHACGTWRLNTCSVAQGAAASSPAQGGDGVADRLLNPDGLLNSWVWAPGRPHDTPPAQPTLALLAAAPACCPAVVSPRRLRACPSVWRPPAPWCAPVGCATPRRTCRGVAGQGAAQSAAGQLAVRQAGEERHSLAVPDAPARHISGSTRLERNRRAAPFIHPALGPSWPAALRPARRPHSPPVHPVFTSHTCVPCCCSFCPSRAAYFICERARAWEGRCCERWPGWRAAWSWTVRMRRKCVMHVGRRTMWVRDADTKDSRKVRKGLCPAREGTVFRRETSRAAGRPWLAVRRPHRVEHQ